MQDDGYLFCKDSSEVVEAVEVVPEDWYCVHHFGGFLDVYRHVTTGQIGIGFSTDANHNLTDGVLALESEGLSGDRRSGLFRWETDQSDGFVAFEPESILRIRVVHLYLLHMGEQFEPSETAKSINNLWDTWGDEDPKIHVLHQVRSGSKEYFFQSNSTIVVERSAGDTVVLPWTVRSFDIEGGDFSFKSKVLVIEDHSMGGWTTVVLPQEGCVMDADSD